MLFRVAVSISISMWWEGASPSVWATAIPALRRSRLPTPEGPPTQFASQSELEISQGSGGGLQLTCSRSSVRARNFESAETGLEFILQTQAVCQIHSRIPSFWLHGPLLLLFVNLLRLESLGSALYTST